jgi:hypothetical protein
MELAFSHAPQPSLSASVHWGVFDEQSLQAIELEEGQNWGGPGLKSSKSLSVAEPSCLHTDG